MACYNSELPIGPPGPTGPQGPPGEGGCCVERIYNDTTTTIGEKEPNVQNFNFSLDENGYFVEFNFDASSGENIIFQLNINENLIFDAAEPFNNMKGTVNITRISSTEISLTIDVLCYGFASTQLLLLKPQYEPPKSIGVQVDLESGLGFVISEVGPYYANFNLTLDPTDITVNLKNISTSGNSVLKVTKVLKYNIPYL
jgi:hypothetical protein